MIYKLCKDGKRNKWRQLNKRGKSWLEYVVYLWLFMAAFRRIYFWGWYAQN